MKNKDYYDNPDRYLQESEANVIKNARSWKSDLRWLNDYLRLRKEEKDRQETEDGESNYPEEKEDIPWLLIALLRIKWFLLTVLYAGCLVIGLPFLGIFWPQPFRKYILSYGNILNDTNGGNEIKQFTRDEVKKLVASAIEELKGTNESCDNKKRTKAKKDGTTSN